MSSGAPPTRNLSEREPCSLPSSQCQSRVAYVGRGHYISTSVADTRLPGVKSRHAAFYTVAALQTRSIFPVLFNTFMLNVLPNTETMVITFGSCIMYSCSYEV